MEPTCPIRFGLIYTSTQGAWLGADNYFKNLIFATLSSSKARLQPVLFTSHQPSELPPEFQGAEIVPSRLFDNGHLWSFCRRAIRRVLKHDWFMERMAQLKKVRLLSHSGYIGPRSRVPAIGWIPDFQHLHLPEYFSPAEINERTSYFKRLGQLCQAIVVSSEDSRRDFKQFFPQIKSPVSVLRFVSCLVKNDNLPGLPDLERKYDFKAPFFLLPNQFWAHKNHELVMRALHLKKQTGAAPLVLATGNTRDHRQPGHFKKLMSLVDSLGIQKEFRVLGLVPYRDLASLMTHCVAIINPSYFEGWATSVEEAKSLGKMTLLSNIAVHREQNPPRCGYFHPDQPGELANLLTKALNEYSPATEAQFQLEARQLLPERINRFALDYQNILLETLGIPQPKIAHV